MDDGGWVKTSRSLRIHVNAFTLEEVEFLVKLLNIKFNFNTGFNFNIKLIIKFLLI